MKRVPIIGTLFIFRCKFILALQIKGNLGVFPLQNHLTLSMLMVKVSTKLSVLAGFTFTRKTSSSFL